MNDKFSIFFDADNNIESLRILDSDGNVKFNISSDDWNKLLDESLSEFDLSLKDIFQAPFTIAKIVALVFCITKVVEVFITGIGQGATKKLFALALWDHYDKKYKLVENIDSEIDLTKSFGKFIGGILEKIDGNIIRFLIENIIIPVVTKLIFKEGNIAKLTSISDEMIAIDNI
jgi:hypothetical protein